MTGLKELQRGLKRANDGTDKELRKRFKEVGEVVRSPAASRLSDYDTGSAAGLKTRVQQKGVKVEQSRRKVTGKRGDYGRLQVRILEDALEENRDEVIEQFEKAVKEIADMVN